MIIDDVGRTLNGNDFCLWAGPSKEIHSDGSQTPIILSVVLHTDVEPAEAAVLTFTAVPSSAPRNTAGDSDDSDDDDLDLTLRDVIPISIETSFRTLPSAQDQTELFEITQLDITYLFEATSGFTDPFTSYKTIADTSNLSIAKNFAWAKAYAESSISALLATSTTTTTATATANANTTATTTTAVPPIISPAFAGSTVVTAYDDSNFDLTSAIKERNEMNKSSPNDDQELAKMLLKKRESEFTTYKPMM